MSSGDPNGRERYCIEQYKIISKEFRNVMARIEAIETAPLKKKKPPKRKTEAARQSTLEKAQSARAACVELMGTIRRVLQELGDDVEEEEDDAPGPSGRPPAN